MKEGEDHHRRESIQIERQRLLQNELSFGYPRVNDEEPNEDWNWSSKPALNSRKQLFL